MRRIYTSNKLTIIVVAASTLLASIAAQADTPATAGMQKLSFNGTINLPAGFKTSIGNITFAPTSSGSDENGSGSKSTGSTSGGGSGSGSGSNTFSLQSLGL